MKKCKICQSTMPLTVKTINNINYHGKDKSTFYHDYKCNKNLDHHLYIERNLDGTLIITKTRLSIDNEDIIFRINYNDSTTEIWNARSDYPEILKLNVVFNPDYSDLNKLKLKIKTFMVFS